MDVAKPSIASTKALYPLKGADRFSKAERGLGGRSVDWEDGASIELDLGADNLRNLAIEQPVVLATNGSGLDCMKRS